MDTNSLNREYIDLLAVSPASGASESAKIRETLTREAAAFNSTPVEFLDVPKFYTAGIDARFRTIAQTLHAILVKVISRFNEDPSYRKLFGYDELEEELILSPSPVSSPLPVMRADLFFDERTGSFKFCEFNTDGSSGMGEEADLVRLLTSTGAFAKFALLHPYYVYDLFEGLIDGFLEAYSTVPEKSSSPLIAITDFMESGVTSEFEEFARRFSRRGLRCVIADIRELEFGGECLTWNGEKIDAVYRRAVTGEMLRKRDQIPGFLSALKSGRCAVIGHPKSQIPHNKVIFEVLAQKETLAFLTEEEASFIKEHIPFTVRLSKTGYDYNGVLLNKEKWVVKPSDFYASVGVCVGADASESEWRAAVENGVREKHLLQEFIPPPKTLSARFTAGGLEESEYGNIVGLYLFNGRYGGMFTRMGQRGVISAATGGYSAASMVVSG